MVTTNAETVVNCAPAEVWSLISDPEAIVQWMPGVESCEVNGDTRVASMAGRQLTELFQVDHARKRFSYQIIDRGALPAFESHHAFIEVLPTDGATRVTYSHTLEPSDFAARIQAASEGTLQALKEYLEQSSR